MDLLARIRDEMLPFAELLGIEFISASPEKIVAEMTVREDLCTRPAVLHGGAIMAFRRHPRRHRHDPQPETGCRDDRRSKARPTSSHPRRSGRG